MSPLLASVSPKRCSLRAWLWKRQDVFRAVLCVAAGSLRAKHWQKVNRVSGSLPLFREVTDGTRDRAGRLRRRGVASLARLIGRADVASQRLAPRRPTFRLDLSLARPRCYRRGASRRQQTQEWVGTALHLIDIQAICRTADVAFGRIVGIRCTSSVEQRHLDFGPSPRMRDRAAAHGDVAAGSVGSFWISCPPIAKLRLTKFEMQLGCSGRGSQNVCLVRDSSALQCEQVSSRCTSGFPEVVNHRWCDRLYLTLLLAVSSDDRCVSFIACALVACAGIVGGLLLQPQQVSLLEFPSRAIGPDLRMTRDGAILHTSAD